jgi:nucleotide-binding universal stress UspA family protein
MITSFTKILVPVDFSACSLAAMHYAASIGERFFSELFLLHVIAREVETYTIHQQVGHSRVPLIGPFAETLDIPATVEETVSVDLHERAKAALQAFLPEQYSGMPCTLHIAVGKPFEQIVDFATIHHVDLIVMGTHGRTGLVHTLMGSVAERVVRLAPCPVLTVKEVPESTASEKP